MKLREIALNRTIDRVWFLINKTLRNEKSINGNGWLKPTIKKHCQ